MCEIVDKGQNITWDDIAGLADVKAGIDEAVVYPMLNSEIFQGLLSPPKGMLLFGPPGTGKTLIAKAIASECKIIYILYIRLMYFFFSFGKQFDK